MTSRRRPLAILAAGLLTVGGAAAQAPSRAGVTALDRAPATTAAPDPYAAAKPQIIAARKAMRRACAGDIAKFCADVAAGRGGVMKCLRARRGELSAGCSEVRAAMRAARAAARS